VVVTIDYFDLGTKVSVGAVAPMHTTPMFGTYVVYCDIHYMYKYRICIYMRTRVYTTWETIGIEVFI